MEAAWWFPGGSEGSVCLQCGTPELAPWVGKIPWRRKWQLTPVFLPGESHGWRSLVGYSPWGCKESDTTEQLHFHFLSPMLLNHHSYPLKSHLLHKPSKIHLKTSPALSQHGCGDIPWAFCLPSLPPVLCL